MGVEGLGRMGKRHWKTLIYRAPQAKLTALTAVCTPAPAELEWARKFFGPESGVEMLEQPGLQAVWVSTSTDLHAQVTTAAIHKNLDVLCEKPLSDRLQARAVKPHLKIMAGYSRRFDASYRSAKAQIDASTIGRSFIRLHQSVRAGKNGAVFVDRTIHGIDLSHWWYLGERGRGAQARLRRRHHRATTRAWQRPTLNDIDNGIAVVENWDGKMACFYASRTQKHGHDVANEANEFLWSVAEDKPVPVGLDLGLKGMEIGWALQKALVTFDRQGRRVEEGGQTTGV
ncbi:hypothetical protein IWX91DRAFT_358085 [Phyllosticta citricarpa]